MQTVRKIGIQAWNQQCKGMKEWQGRKEDKDEITVKPEVIMKEWQEYILQKKDMKFWNIIIGADSERSI